MEKRTQKVFLTLIVLASVFVVITAYSQENVKVVKDSAFIKTMRPLVPFLHDQHNENAQIEECGACHHVYREGKLVKDESSEGSPCSECHALANDSNPIPLARVYHLQCKGCHQQRKAGPVMCAECHQKTS